MVHAQIRGGALYTAKAYTLHSVMRMRIVSDRWRQSVIITLCGLELCLDMLEGSIQQRVFVVRYIKCNKNIERNRYQKVLLKPFPVTSFSSANKAADSVQSVGI